MTLAIFNDALDDTPQKEEEPGFFSLNNSLKATLLERGTLQRAQNVICGVTGLADTRPGLRLVSNIFAATNATIAGLGYYDIPTKEAVLVESANQVWAIAGDVGPQTPVSIAASAAGGSKQFAQLVDRMFWATGSDLRWLQWNGSTWVTGVVQKFSDNTTNLPAFKSLVAHKFRLFGLKADSDEIYVSKYLQAHNSGTSGDWVLTEQVRVGNGGGDPGEVVLSGQDANLVVLNQGSCWMIDTTAAAAANWPIRKVTDKLGCCAGATAVTIGQDVLFLSTIGLVSLGALANTDSISPAIAISAPIQATINRINWAAVGTCARATLWREYYLLAVPLDGSTWANCVLAYNTITKKWVGEWTTLNPQLLNTPGGWGVPVITRFGGKESTLWADVDGGLYRLDETYEYDDSTNARFDIETIALTRAMVFEAPDNQKQLFWLEAEFFKATSTSISIALVRDDSQAYPEIPLENGDLVGSTLIGTNYPVVPHTVPLTLTKRYVRRQSFTLSDFGRCRELAVLIVSKNRKLALRGVKVAAFIDTVDIVP